VGDQGQSIISRVFLEKVKGVYQGASFMFRSGFASGVLRLAWASDGSLFTGQTNRGWSSTGPQPFAIQRLVYSGIMPFEMKEISARPDGFEITFTKPVNKSTAQNPASYSVQSFIYQYHAKYGSPVINPGRCPIKGIRVAEDGMKVRLVLDSLRQYYIHEVKASGVLSASENWPLLHDAGYYTLNEIPEGEKLNLATLPALPKPPAPPTVKPVSKPITPSAPKAPAAPKPPLTTASSAPKHLEKMPASWTRGPDKTMSIGTVPGLKFDQKMLVVDAGAKVRLIFNNYDDMQHNLVIVKPGTVSKVGEAANKLGINGNKLNYVPISDDVLYHTTILQPESAQTIYFEAPKQAGDYTIVCTMPGHWVSMQAVLRVR
jgi:azurin